MIRFVQAEVFVLRLSRNSGVLGLAGMASTSQIFPNISKFNLESSNNVGILLIRPLLDFTKDDLYKICKYDNQKWVEDPTNRSSLFARNRIRMALQDINTGAFRSELQALIAICRRTRLCVDHICQNMLKEAVTIMPYGYAVIDLEILNTSNMPEICLSRFLTLVLQFTSQRHRPVRGSASKLLVQYIRSFPCKTSFTAAGCYLSAVPGCKGTKVFVCCSFDSSRPANSILYSKLWARYGTKQHIQCDVDQIIMDQKSRTKYQIPKASDIHFLNTLASYTVLNEARKSKVLSESTFESISELQNEEKEIFKYKKEISSGNESKNNENSAPSNREPFRPGECCYFMNKFLLSWNLKHKSDSIHCKDGDMLAYIRQMVDEDWLYLANLTKAKDSDKLKGQKIPINNGVEALSSNHARLSAEQALRILKSIPAAARRGLPVIVNEEGILLSIPSIGFNHCPSMVISCEFRPRVPLGGGHSSFMQLH